MKFTIIAAHGYYLTIEVAETIKKYFDNKAEIIYILDNDNIKQYNVIVDIENIIDLKELSAMNENYDLLIDFKNKWITIADDWLS